MKFNIRLLYLYLFSFVGLLIVVIGSIQLVDLGLKTYIFKNADSYISYPMVKSPDEVNQPSEEEMQKYQKEQARSDKERQVSNAIAMILIGTPLYFYHWRTIQKDNQDKNEENA